MAAISLRDMTYDKERKTLSYSWTHDRGHFPKDVIVASHHTGRTVRFVPDYEAAAHNDFWDGEQMVYVPEESLRNIVQLILHHPGIA